SNNSATDACVIQHNLFKNNYNPADTQGYAYSGNDNRSIYTDGSISGGKLTNVTIDANAFIYTLTPPDNVEGAIGLECYTSGAQTNIRITNNYMDGVGKGILYYDVVGMTVTGNTITHVGDVWTGVFRDEGNSQNVTIQYNNVYDSYGPVLRIDQRAAPGDSAGYHFNNNNVFADGYSVHGGISFQQQTGINAAVYIDPNSYNGTIDLTNNWWGAANGPSGAYSGSGVGIVSENKTPLAATVSPWASAPVVATETAFMGFTPADGAPIQAEYYNTGGINIAYYNTSATDPGTVFRNGETVGLYNSTDTGGGFYVGATAPGQWLDYTVNITATGTYRFDLRVATSAAATAHLPIDGATSTASIAIPNTGGTNKWNTVSLNNLSLTSGTHTFRLYIDSGSPNINWFQFINTATSVPPSVVTSLAATAASASQINLTWGNTSTTQSGVKVQRSLDGTNWTTLATVGASTNDYIDSGLTAGTSYSYRVIATGLGGDAAASNVATIATLPASSVPTYLSDLTWGSATAGYGTVQKDKTIVGNAITLNGVAYSKGLGTHAASTVVYQLGGAYTTFQSDVGIDDEENGKGIGSVDFQVIGDGKVLFDSGVLNNGNPPAHINISVAGVQTLTLIANNGVAGSIDYDHADWAGAALYGTPVAPAAPLNLAATALSSSSIQLTWTANSASQTNYAIDRSTDGVNFTTLTASIAATATSYTDNAGLSANTKYYYRVRAVNSAGSSGNSNIANATTQQLFTVTYVSDLTAVSSTTGWGTIQKDKSIVGNPLTLNGVVYSKGIGTHAASSITYNIGGAYSYFVSDVGIDQEEDGKGQGYVDFQVVGDGKVLFDSGVLTNDQVAHINVNVSGIQSLTLIANNGVADNIDYDHADWAGTELLK
ncbi:MAG: NPCBM/NEW2 domain-containing protein, partial [Phycisphaerae bacterium]|nr:NPCBM/NEW2 domain-containing protein [Phycisphaerae bacterium]